MVATSALGALPVSLLLERSAVGVENSNSVLEREALIDRIVGSMQNNLSAAGFEQIVLGRAPVVNRPLLEALIPIDVLSTFGTKYDASEELMRYAVQYGYWKGQNGKARVKLVAAGAGKNQYLPPDMGYGNGFYWGQKDCFVTARHTVDSAEARPQNREALDISVLRLPPDLQARDEQVVHDDPALRDNDIHGAYVKVVGIDPDKTSLKGAHEGCKGYPGVAIQLRPRWVDRAFANAEQYFKERLYRSFVMLLPAGETKGEGDARPVAGMSGSPVVVMRNGRKIVAGLFHSSYHVTPLEFGRPLDLGFFYGPGAIRQVIEDAKRRT